MNHKNPKWPDTPGSHFPAPQATVLQGDLEADFATDTHLIRRFQWDQINEVTWKLANTAAFSDTPTSHGWWQGYRTRKAVAWLIGLGGGQWLARCGDRSAGPMTIAKAKKMALAMALDPGTGKRLLDPIGNLNRLQACLLDANGEALK